MRALARAWKKDRRCIRMQVKTDIKAAKKLRLRWWAILALMACCIPVFVVFDHFDRLNMALPVLDCAGVLGLFIYLKWHLRRQVLFWTTMSLLAGLHALLIWYIPWTDKWVPAAAIAGIMSIDLCAMIWILAAIETLLGGQEAR
jgi:hypothetical protein